MNAEHTTTDPPPDRARLVEMNEALLLGSVRQHELTDAAESLNAQLQVEIEARASIAAELADKARLLDLTHDAIIVRDMEGHIRYWNQGAEELYGWSREEVLGEVSHLLLQTEFPTPLEQLTEELHRTGRWIGELIHTTRDGQRVTVLARKTLDRDDYGQPVAVLENLTNITARKQAEATLRESESFNRSIIESSPDCIKVLDLDGNLLSMASGQKLLGIEDLTPFLHKSWIELWEGEHRLAARAAVAVAVASGEGKFIGLFRTLRGEPKWWDVAISPILDAQGRAARLLAVSRDVTAYLAGVEALRASEGLFSSLVEKAPFGTYVVDDQFRLQQVNSRALPVFGNVHPLLGRDFTEVVEILWGEEVGGKIAAIFRHTLETGEPYLSPPFTERRQDLDVEQSYEWEVQRVILPNGRRAAVCYFADISERRALENAIADRAADLVRADRSKDEFLAMLAHELRNPLAPLRNAAEILQTEGASAEACALAQGILTRQIENMSQMIDDLLDVSRITEGKVELRPQVVALADVLNAAASLARPGIEARGQELKITLPSEPVFLNADATRLDQVFGNLLTNACKYSGSGCHIAVSAERVGELPEVIVRVRDDGIGIAPEFLPRIFDLFVQATRSLDRASGGLGIGLTLVHRLVKLHGGSIEARSAGLGHGSEFIVRLPILTAAAATAPPAATPARDTPRRILIVDDNADSARSMAALQTLRGHTTRTAFAGPEALAAAAEFSPDVVLLDIGLPGMDGYEVARQLRAMPALTGAFLEAMSGYGSDEDRARARLAGFDEYLVKPADHNLLRTWMRSRG